WIANSLSPQEIRERMMDKNSEFRVKMVQYLEGAHKGEFIDNSKDQVAVDVSYHASNPRYQDPTQTLPKPPPYSCSHELNQHCNTCQESETWWMKFKDTVNDILLKSNVHQKCDDRCLVEGICKARFPRSIFHQTTIDESGYIQMKKFEPMINTYTPALTYLLRSNSDVTSLLSGTALKLVTAYVTDYITKTPLKTYTIFQTIKDVYDHQASVLGGSLKDQEKARKLLTQIVNSLTVKMEIGAPMASAYLLGNPDHYTSHRFQTVFWRSYVSEVMKSWDSNDLQTSADNMRTKTADKVMIWKTKEGYTPYSVVMDYTHCSKEYENVNLYDWIRLSHKKVIPKKKKQNIPDPDTSDDGIDIDYTNQEVNANHKYDSDVDNDKEKDYIQEKVNPATLTFLPNHPQHNSHYITLVKEGFGYVPNFIGGSLPRRDTGNREFYCTTMMTLFKPWRSGLDLRENEQTWDDAFNEYNFTSRQEQLMSFFNIQYECYEARDNYSRQRKAGKILGLPNFIDQESLDYMGLPKNQADDMEIFDATDEHLSADACNEIGPQSAQRLKQMDEMHSILQGAGWLDKCVDPLPANMHISIKPIEPKSRQEWVDIIQRKKTSIIEDRDKHKQSNPTNNVYSNNGKPKWNQVEIIDQSYLLSSYLSSSPDIAKSQQNVVNMFSLRPDQERAFHIIANYASL
ncbi:hypothetical protein NEOLEDRAFT_1025068, partial [Neolentinus lepideus HHB14362 ss-1]